MIRHCSLHDSKVMQILIKSRNPLNDEVQLAIGLHANEWREKKKDVESEVNPAPRIAQPEVFLQ